MTTQISVAAGGGADHTTIASAVAALPSPASGWTDDYEILVLDSSTYSAAAGLVVAVAATSTYPLVIRSAVGQRAVITNSASGQALLVNGSTNGTFRNFDIDGFFSTPGVNATAAATDMTFADCRIRSQFGTAVSCPSGVANDDWTFDEDCIITSTTGSAITGISAEDSSGWVIRRTTFDDLGTACNLVAMPGVLIERCEWTGNVATSCLQISNSADIVAQNLIFDRVVATNYVIRLTGSTTGAHVYNNTFHKASTSAANLITVDAGATSCDIKNNTLRLNSASGGLCIVVAAGAAASLTSDYNIIYRTGSTTVCSDGTNRTFAAWQGLGYDTNSVAVDPDHTDEGNGDYTPSSFSAATVDAGTTLPNTEDYLGNARPQAVTYDIGAYEFEVESDAPDVSPVSPLSGAVRVALDTSIVVDITDVGSGVDQTTIVVEVNHAGGGLETAYTGSSDTFSAPYDGTGSAVAVITDGFRITLDPTTDFDSASVVSVRVQADDSAAVPNSVDLTYSFSTIEFMANLSPDTVEKHGGFRVTATGSTLADGNFIFHVGPTGSAADAEAYGGSYGNENVVTVDSGTFSFVTPPLDVASGTTSGTQYHVFAEPDAESNPSGVGGLLPSGLTYVHKTHRSGVHIFRSLQPPWYRMTARVVTEEPPQGWD